MIKKAVLLLAFVMFMVTPLAIAQDQDKPTIALFKYGTLNTVALAEKGVLDMLAAYDYINEGERASLDQGRSIEGENIRVIYGDAFFDRAQANSIIEGAIDQGADVLVTFTTQLTQIA